MNDVIEIAGLQGIIPHLEGAKEPIVLVLENGSESFCGQVVEGIFGYKMGVEAPKVGATIRDFVRYETAHGRTPIVFVLKGVSLPGTMQDQDESSSESWVVHSTDSVSGEAILDSRCLYSHSCLCSQDRSFRAFGRRALGEPEDYFDLINFASVEGFGPEIVVASKEHNRFCTETDEYQPGMRFYFRFTGLKEQTGYTAFMGGHAVRGSLSLDLIDHHVVSASDLPASSSWTPRTFTEAANQEFVKRISGTTNPADA